MGPAQFTSRHQCRVHDFPESYPDPATPFTAAVPLAVPMPPDRRPKFDVYIDDIFGVFREADLLRGARVVPLVLHLLGRPQDPLDATPRENLLSLDKFVAEARQFAGSRLESADTDPDEWIADLERLRQQMHMMPASISDDDFILHILNNLRKSTTQWWSSWRTISKLLEEKNEP